MTANRLDYETLTGNLDASSTYKQLIENLTLAIEDAQSLSQMAKARASHHRAGQWAGFAKRVQAVVGIIEGLGQGAGKTSVGYRQ